MGVAEGPQVPHTRLCFLICRADAREHGEESALHQKSAA